MHMYTQHFRLNKLPFENVPDPQFFYNQGDHARIREQISGSLESGRGLIVVTGPIGSGKTTLSQMIKADFPESIKLIWMAEPPANSNDLYLFLAQELEERLARSAATSNTEQTDQIITHGVPLLLRLFDTRWEQKALSRFRDADLVFESPRGRVSLSLCNQRNMTSLAGRLRRLREQAAEQVLEDVTREKFVLLRDARLPISSNARRTREHRDQLAGAGFHWLTVSAEMVAALDALRGLLSDAKAGDLANGGEALLPATVQDWLRDSLDAKLRPLRDLLDVLLPEVPATTADDPDFNLCEDISELLHNHFVVSVADAACKLDRAENIIEACARRNPERFGVLNGQLLSALERSKELGRA